MYIKINIVFSVKYSNHLIWNTRRLSIAYANDVVIVIESKFQPTITDFREIALQNFLKWEKSKCLNIKPRKTELVFFTRNYKTEDFKGPIQDGGELWLSPEAN